MDDPHPDRMALPRRRGPPSRLETLTPLPETVTEFTDITKTTAVTLRGIAKPPCCGIGMHPRQTDAQGSKVYALCGHCGRSLVITPLDGDRVHVRVVR